jgi:hypothetical protein
MKKMLLVLGLMLAVALPASANGPAGSPEFGVSFDVFYSSLDPYGEWIQLQPQFYVWRPLRVAAHWRPYFQGEWAWTSDGWYWISDEPWAWAAYHYGRWYYDDYYGWVWMPGYDWAPAWVEWRYSNDVIGWAPLSPYAVFQAGFGIRYSRSWVTPNFYWCFAGLRYMGGVGLYRHIYDVGDNHRYLGMTRSADGIRFENSRIINRGPDRTFVQERGGGPVRESRVIDVRERSEQGVTRQGDLSEIRVYRPRTNEGLSGSETARPGRVRQAERTPSLDLGRTDLSQRMRGETRVPSRQQVSPQPVTPREQPGVRRVPDARSREQQRAPRATPDVNRQVQPRQDRTKETPRRSVQQQMNRSAAPAQRQQDVRTPQVRQPGWAAGSEQRPRVERFRQEGTRKTEGRRAR